MLTRKKGWVVLTGKFWNGVQSIGKRCNCLYFKGDIVVRRLERAEETH
jgi:hypothetical protein